MFVPLLASLILHTAPNSQPLQAGQQGQPGQQRGQRGQRGQRPPGMPPQGAPGAVPPGTPATPAPGEEDGPLAPTRANVPNRWVTTHHTITIGGKPFEYDATCGFLPVKDRAGAITANMFFVAYTRPGEDRLKRPVTFAFNGGPGSSSVWLHMGALGPRRARMNDDGSMPNPPYDVVDNQETWVPFTDVVMLDAVGTGYSRTVNPTDRQYYSANGDLEAFTSAIQSYVSDTNRWRSPVYVVGESYGGYRVAGLSQTLLQAGIACSGIVSISGVMNMTTLDGGKDNDLPFVSFLPSMSAVAWYHKRLDQKHEASLQNTVKEAEKFDLGDYTTYLAEGDTATPEFKMACAKELHALLGLPLDYIIASDLRIPDFAFMGKLLQDKGESVGRYDARLVGKVSNPSRGFPDYDPSDAATSPVFTAAINDYLKTELNFNTPEEYLIMGRNGWDDQGRPDTSDALRQAMTQNPALKVMFCCSWFDLACPFFGTRYVVAHMGEPDDLQGNIQFQYFPAGHMMYIDTPSRQKLVSNAEAFIAKAPVRGVEQTVSR